MKPYEYVVNEIRLGPVAKMINDYPTHYLCLLKKKNRNSSHYEHKFSLWTLTIPILRVCSQHPKFAHLCLVQTKIGVALWWWNSQWLYSELCQLFHMTFTITNSADPDEMPTSRRGVTLCWCPLDTKDALRMGGYILFYLSIFGNVRFRFVANCRTLMIIACLQRRENVIPTCPSVPTRILMSHKLSFLTYWD